MDAFCLASIEHVFEHDLIEYKSFNALKINFSAFIEGASKVVSLCIVSRYLDKTRFF